MFEVGRSPRSNIFQERTPWVSVRFAFPCTMLVSLTVLHNQQFFLFSWVNESEKLHKCFQEAHSRIKVHLILSEMNNYCRNLVEKEKPWCFTSETDWGYCEVSQCKCRLAISQCKCVFYWGSSVECTKEPEHIILPYHPGSSIFDKKPLPWKKKIFFMNRNDFYFRSCKDRPNSNMQKDCGGKRILGNHSSDSVRVFLEFLSNKKEASKWLKVFMASCTWLCSC